VSLALFSRSESELILVNFDTGLIHTGQPVVAKAKHYCIGSSYGNVHYCKCPSRYLVFLASIADCASAACNCTDKTLTSVVNIEHIQPAVNTCTTCRKYKCVQLSYRSAYDTLGASAPSQFHIRSHAPPSSLHILCPCTVLAHQSGTVQEHRRRPPLRYDGAGELKRRVGL
jgi:hypothetical protein